MKPALGLLLAAFFLAAPARAADLVVVEARGVDLQAGTTLDDSKPLVLKGGQAVTLVGADGNLFKLRGPYDKPPAPQDGGIDVANALASFGGGSRTEVATVRMGADVRLPSPWVVDVAHSGNVCLREGQAVVFWRPPDVEGSTLTIVPSDRSWRARVQWPAAAPTLKASDQFAFRDGDTYLADFGGESVSIAVNTIPASLANSRMQAAWMYEKGCVAQARALVGTGS